MIPIFRRFPIAVILVICASEASAQAPAGADFMPSEWGSNDERGATNRLTPKKFLEATQLIREGKIYELGRVYEAGMPLFPGRHYILTIPGSPTGGPLGKNNIVYHDEMVSGQIGQVGTQFDGLGHIGTRIDGEDVLFNGFKRSEFGAAGGLGKLGVEDAGVFVTRGVLVDMAGFKDVERLPVGTVITAQDLQAALERQSVELSQGDVVLIHTGHGALWMVDNEGFTTSKISISRNWQPTRSMNLPSCLRRSNLKGPQGHLVIRSLSSKKVCYFDGSSGM